MDSMQPSTSTIYTTKIEHRWTICNFSNLLSASSSSFIFSETFPPKNDEFSFSLRLQPKYVDEKGDKYVSIFLHLRQSKHANLKTTFRISLFSPGMNSTEFNVKDEKDVLFSNEICRGFSNFILQEKLEELLPLFGNSLIILCQITINSLEEFIIKTPKSSSTFKANKNVITFTHKWIVDDFSTFYYDNMDKTKASLKLDYAWPTENDDLKFYPVLIMTNEEQTKLEYEKSYISLYLYFESDFIEEVMASYRVSILDWKNKFYVTGEGYEKFISKGDGKGPKYFISCDDLMDLHKGLLRKDKLTIFGRIEASELLTAEDKILIMEKVSKLKELKEMLIGWKILKEISDDKWREYERKNDIKWIENECFKILLSDEVIGIIKDKSENEVWAIFNQWSFLYTITLSSESTRSVQHSLVQLCSSMSARVNSKSGDQWNRHRVVCWAVESMVMKCGDKWSDETYQCLIEYFVKLFEHCDDMKTVKCAILTLKECCLEMNSETKIKLLLEPITKLIEQCENMQMLKWIITNMEECWLRTTMSSDTKEQLVMALQGHTSYLSQVNITRDYQHLDSVRYEANWCAKWCIDNGLGQVGLRKQMPLIKLSRDRCCARNDNKNWPIPIRSPFAVTSGEYYYEVIPLTKGKMSFGWSTREAKLSDEKNLGNDEHSICLELSSECYIYHQGKQHSILNKLSLQPVNVIGCLIDVDNRQFVFYLNGQKVEWHEAVHFSSNSSYYATAELFPQQHCQFNFEQSSFKFPPNNDRLGCIVTQNVKEYQFTETNQYRKCFWFVHHVIDNQVDLFYCDPKQTECDELVRQLEHFGHSQITQLDNSVEVGRLVQSLIEVVDRRLTSDHTDILTRWVKKLIEATKYSHFERAKLLELLNPYTQLSFTSTNSTKCHNICLIIIMIHFKDSLMFELIQNFDNLFCQTIQTFLSRKIFTTDPWTMIYVFNCFESFLLPHTIRALVRDNSLLSTLWWCAEFSHMSKVKEQDESSSTDLVRLQAEVCARRFYDRVMGGMEQYFPSQSTLNPEDKTKHIKLSSDCLAVRNDDDAWHSVRSMFSVSSDIFYYETVLLTCGKMRIGWATKQTQLNESEMIGWDEHSIGFNGSDGHGIYHQFENFHDDSHFSNFTSKPRWSAGDVVGCLIDFNKKTFKFYLNGKLIKQKFVAKSKYEEGKECFVHFSDEPFYAAVSLSPHQQCFLNFGQQPMKHRPNVPFRTFHEVSVNGTISKASSYQENKRKTILNLLFPLRQQTINQLKRSPPPPPRLRLIYL